MTITRRECEAGTGLLAGAAALNNVRLFAEQPFPTQLRLRRPARVTRPWLRPTAARCLGMEDGVKEFHLIAEPVKREFAPGMTVNCWGYNGRTPGPDHRSRRGDRVRILVTNQLPEPTTMHWHGVLLPNGMDGVGGPDPAAIAGRNVRLRIHAAAARHPHVSPALRRDGADGAWA